MKTELPKSLMAFYLVISICGMGNIFVQKVEFVPLFEKGAVKFHEMTWAGEIPGHPGNFMVLEQLGPISKLYKESERWQKEKLGEVEALRRGSIQNGAYSIAFHPGFRENGKFYLLYRSKKDERSSFIEEWFIHPQTLDQVEKLRTIMEIEQKNNHGSGNLIFGPDGYLWSGQAHHNGNATSLNWLGGKILRIDVNKKDPGLEYAIPPDNPFVGIDGAREEIWARGVRVPWRMSFDPMTDELWMGDVGGNKYEEINVVEKGMDYGSENHEGFCDCSEFKDPVLALERETARSVTGGYVYRNNSSSKFYGKYIFADFETNKLFAIDRDQENVTLEDIGDTPKEISHLMIDSSGVWYALSWNDGLIYQLVHPELQAGTPISVSQSQSPQIEKNHHGLLFLDGSNSRAANGRLIPYRNRNFSVP